MVTPRYLNDLLLDRGTLFMWMCISGWELLRANNWYVDLCILSVSLLLASHVAMSEKLVLIVI